MPSFQSVNESVFQGMGLSDVYNAEVEAGRLKADPAQMRVFPELERVKDAVETPVKRGLFRRKSNPVKGLYMWGGVGRGKSMLMDMLFEQAEANKERWHFHAFMQWVHGQMAEVRKTGVDDAIQPVAEDLASRIRFLAFDEMQITDITDAMIVGRLFEGLFEAGVVIVTTSNRPPSDLYKDGLNRQLFEPFIALLEEKMSVHELVSETDYRQGRLEGSPTYFTPLGAESRKAMDAVWESFAGSEATPLHLKVKGRDVTLPKFHNGAAKAGFFDLCGKPLGAADYLAIAEAVRVLFLSDIPQLSRQNFNEAKRFVLLIDALYEARVRLICTAAAEPEMLYVEGTGAFEFERTASRLREMQSADWP